MMRLKNVNISILTIIVMVFLVSCNNTSTPEKALLGKWKHETDDVYLDFEAKEANIKDSNGRTIFMTYIVLEMNTDDRTIWIETTTNSGNSTKRVYAFSEDYNKMAERAMGNTNVWVRQ